MFERADLPWDPFTLPLRSADSSSIEPLRRDLEALLGDVLQAGTKRRLYGIVFSMGWSEEGGVVPRATLSVNADLNLTHFSPMRRSKTDPPGS